MCKFKIFYKYRYTVHVFTEENPQQQLFDYCNIKTRWTRRTGVCLYALNNYVSIG